MANDSYTVMGCVCVREVTCRQPINTRSTQLEAGTCREPDGAIATKTDEERDAARRTLQSWYRTSTAPGTYVTMFLTCWPHEHMDVDDLRQCVNLQTLYISSNVLTCIPEIVGQLPALQHLTLEYCTKLRYISGPLMELATLHLSKCEQLEHIPGVLPSLEKLTCWHCFVLRNIPVSRKAIQRMDLKACYGLSEHAGCGAQPCNDLCVIQESSWVPALSFRQLHLSRMSPRAIGVAICESTVLTKLRIQISRIFALPGPVASTLQSLELVLCDVLTQIPDHLVHASHLVVLTVKHCAALQSLPESLGQLKRLATLQVEHCPAITEIPAAVGSISSLRLVSLQYLRTLKRLPLALVYAPPHLTITCEGLNQIPPFHRVPCAIRNPARHIRRRLQQLKHLVFLLHVDGISCH